jgi:hypothetical protein
MAIEIFGILLEKEISIGDIIATLGLVATAITFYISYKRTRRVEQLRLFLERFVRLSEKYGEFKNYARDKINITVWERNTLSNSEQKKRYSELLSRFDLALNELALLTNLKYEKDISPDIVGTTTCSKRIR